MSEKFQFWLPDDLRKRLDGAAKVFRMSAVIVAALRFLFSHRNWRSIVREYNE